MCSILINAVDIDVLKSYRRNIQAIRDSTLGESIVFAAYISFEQTDKEKFTPYICHDPSTGNFSHSSYINYTVPPISQLNNTERENEPWKWTYRLPLYEAQVIFMRLLNIRSPPQDPIVRALLGFDPKSPFDDTVNCYNPLPRVSMRSLMMVSSVHERDLKIDIDAYQDQRSRLLVSTGAALDAMNDYITENTPSPPPKPMEIAQMVITSVAVLAIPILTLLLRHWIRDGRNPGNDRNPEVARDGDRREPEVGRDGDGREPNERDGLIGHNRAIE